MALAVQSFMAEYSPVKAGNSMQRPSRLEIEYVKYCLCSSHDYAYTDISVDSTTTTDLTLFTL